MAGHSHWAGIRHKKSLVDARRGKMFSKLARNIITAARSGGGDPETNLRLKYAIEKAKAANMPKENIERAILKGTGALAGEELYELRYEGYGPGNVAMMIEVVTDNKNRTAAEIRKIIETRGGKLGGVNSVAFRFEKKGLIMVKADEVDEDELLEAALDAGAEDMERLGDMFQITTSVEEFEAVRTALAEKNFPIESAEITQVPKDTVALDEETGRKVLELLDALEDHEDVQNVYANFTLPEALLTSSS